MNFELRLVMPEGTTTEQPIIQARQAKNIAGVRIETPWENVPIVYNNQEYERAKKSTKKPTAATI